jgi:type II secretory pathway pseudopilin PulG
MVDALIGMVVLAVCALSAMALLSEAKRQLSQQKNSASALSALRECLEDETLLSRNWRQGRLAISRTISEIPLTQPVLNEHYLWLSVDCQVRWSLAGRNYGYSLSRRILARR